ncbi:conserved Plasmodium protein, unknown function [Plasmodium malariae]|uniref:Uncharacterized protein n=3 Tax=Plasmodium (Plasmodium) TaxID=418103 RepID=A0A1D3JJB9_PLAMA|nr:conserved Plasmodium protein, unknown function [Plasmodium malariae]SBT86476.1 conserved Plasmodium protein, unknown function [Plasmodium malariae]
MKGKGMMKLRYLDSKGALYSNGIIYEQNEDLWKRTNNPNYNLVKNYSELQDLLSKEEAQFELVKKEVHLLQKQKDLLQWHICNNIKKLSMKRSEKKFKEETRSKLETKLKLLKDKTKINKFEHDTLEEEVNKFEEALEKQMDIKSNTEMKFTEWLNKKDEYLKDITQERISAFKERKKRQNQLRKLLMVTKQENNKNFNIDYLQKCEINLINEIKNYRNYKTFETKRAKDLINELSFNGFRVS